MLEFKPRRWLVMAVVAVVAAATFLPQPVQARRLVDLRVSPGGGSMFSGQTLIFRAFGVYDDGSEEQLRYPNVTWDIVFMSPDDPTAATIDKNGWLTVCKAPLNLRVAATQGGTVSNSPLLVSSRAQIAVPAQAKDVEMARKRAYNQDSDSDGLPDRVEHLLGTQASNSDSDGDGFLDGEEIRHGTSPISDSNLYSDQSRMPSWSRKPLLELAARGIVQGDKKANINPARVVTRAELLQMIMLVAEVDLNSLTITSDAFTDVPQSDPRARFINHAAALGLVAGYTDGTFRPNEKINRAEAIKLMLDAARLFWFQYHISDNNNSEEAPFADVSEIWQKRYLSAAANIGLVKGYADGTFRPKKNISLAETAKLLNGLLEQEPLWDRLIERVCKQSASNH